MISRANRFRLVSVTSVTDAIGFRLLPVTSVTEAMDFDVGEEHTTSAKMEAKTNQERKIRH